MLIHRFRLFLTRFPSADFRRAVNHAKSHKNPARRITRHCHCKRTRARTRVKSGCVNDGYAGLCRQVHRSFLTTYADRGAFFRARGIFLCVRTSYTMICKAPLVGQKKRMSTRGLPTFPLKVINSP